MTTRPRRPPNDTAGRDEWARRLAAQLLPFTAEQIAAFGHMAAMLDARRAAAIAEEKEGGESAS
jgi:hypothetical protein